MSEEINETSSTEEVQAYADQVLQEVENEKSDSQVVSDHANNKIPASEMTLKDKPKSEIKNSVDNDDDNSVDNDDEPAIGKPSPKWLTDEVKADVAAYGLDESEISDFASREELDRALRLFDKNALELGRQEFDEEESTEDESPKRNEKGQFEKREVQGTRSKVSLDPEEFHEDLVDAISSIQEDYDSRIAQLEERFQEVFVKAENQEFDNMVDSLKMPTLFGYTDEESESELSRRRNLHTALKAQLIGLERLGRPAVVNQNLVSRVARMVFAEELAKQDIKKRTRKVSRQSNMRQGGSVVRPQDPHEDPREYADRLYREMEHH